MAGLLTGAGSDGRALLLLPRGQRLPWKFSSSFASAVTAPMVTQAPPGGGGVSSHRGGLAGVGLNVAVKVWGAAGAGGGTSDGIYIYPGSPASSLKLKSGGHSGQKWLRKGRSRLEGSWYPPRVCVESVA